VRQRLIGRQRFIGSKHLTEINVQSARFYKVFL
jgi:hypothetical protein